MIQDLFLRCVVTALFALSAAECVYAIVSGRRVWTHFAGQFLHLVMAIAMVMMAWPSGPALPTTGPIIFFLLATVWFVVMSVAESSHRAVNAYHVLMMVATAWMYAVMSGSLLPAPSEGAGSGGGHGAHHMSSAASMPGMDMPGMAAPSESTGYPPFVIGLNWLCTIGFAIAAVWWLYRYFAQRTSDPTQPPHRLLGIVCQAMMAAGMAIMFAVML